jgi:hypothetical protein
MGKKPRIYFVFILAATVFLVCGAFGLLPMKTSAETEETHAALTID